METETAERDLAEVFYASMREELMKRLELRERARALTVTALVALLGFAARLPEFETYILVIMGLLSLGGAILVSEHSRMLAFVAEYLYEECQRYSTRVGSAHWQPWETSPERRAARKTEYRLIGHSANRRCSSFHFSLRLSWVTGGTGSGES